MCQATFATLGSVKKLGKQFKDLGVSLLIMDECHLHSNPEGGMFTDFLSDLAPTTLIGYTASPFRLKNYTDPSGYSYSQLSMLNRTRPKIFKDIIHVTQIHELTSRGYWAPVELHIEPFNPLGLVLNSNGSEYTESSVQEVVKSNNVNNRIYKQIKSLISDGVSSILVFLDTVENCYTMKNALGDCAEVIEANTKKKDRELHLSNFKNKNLKVILNVNTLTVGFDYPELQVVMMGRPTNSLAVFYQIYGRLVRPYEGKVGKFFDYGGNLEKFGKMEELTIENYNNYGWGIFNNENLLTGVPMSSPPTTKKELDGVKRNEFKNSSKNVFEFGKYSGKKASEVEKQYLGWASINAKHLMSEILYNDIMKIINPTK